MNRQTVFCKKESRGNSEKETKVNYMQKREERRDEGDLGFFFGEYEKDD